MTGKARGDKVFTELPCALVEKLIEYHLLCGISTVYKHVLGYTAVM